MTKGKWAGNSSPPDAAPDELKYPALGELPPKLRLTACEVLCWIGYGRDILKEVYLAPLVAARGARLTEATMLPHHFVPDPKPAECPMDDAERELIEALRTGKLRAFFKADGAFREVPAELYTYAVTVNVRGSIEPNCKASKEDFAEAEDFFYRIRPSIRDVFFDSAAVKAALAPWPRARAVEPAAAPPLRSRHNGTDYRSSDKPLMTDMQALIESRRARSSEDAARAVVDRADGKGSDASKVKRLAKRYRKFSQR